MYDDRVHILDQTRYITFEQLQRYLLSHEKAYKSEFFNSDRIRFLKPGSIKDNLASLLSYPRAGNSFARTLLEAVTNVVTGSDMRANLIRPLYN
jgi:hypothetical protein